MFEGRSLLIATKHKKERVIQPLIKSLKVKCFVPQNYDTDTFGTFTGEIERKDDSITTVRRKCLAAMQLYHCDLGIASEGSFGPHPSLYFLNANEEILIFIDRKNDLEIIAREISTETNFDGAEIHTEDQLIRFANKSDFPSHALILRADKSSKTDIVKGISKWDHLVGSFYQLLKKGPSVYVETDMRAMYNPTRMNVIEKATHQLLEKIHSCCPECKTPGFSIADAKAGLPCSWCNFPTRSIKSYIYKCQKCAFEEEKNPHAKTSEDPMYCDLCNP